MPTRSSIQEILQRRRADTFEGRIAELDLFKAHLEDGVPEDEIRILFFVSGQAGVGKTTLLRRYLELAQANKVLAAITDETEQEVPAVLGRLADQLKEQGSELKGFQGKHQRYQELKEQIEADPSKPTGTAAFIGRTITGVALGVAKLEPSGLARTTIELIGEEELKTHAGAWLNYLTEKFKRKEDLALMRDPAKALTPLFLADLNALLDEGRVVFCFDTFERTSYFLDKWLRAVLEGGFGSVNSNLLLVVAGRDPLSQAWLAFEPLIARQPLEPWSKSEALRYLSKQEVTEQAVVEEIWRLSKGLPVLVAAFAAQKPRKVEEVGGAISDAVDRLLRWVKEPDLRSAAVTCAIPRIVNADILAHLVGSERAGETFIWLKSQPFFEERPDHWRYHEHIREILVRYRRAETPPGYTELHERLVTYYGALLQQAEKLDQATVRLYKTERLYHLLAVEANKGVNEAISFFVSLLKSGTMTGVLDIATMVEQVGRENSADRLLTLGSNLCEALNAFNERSWTNAASALETIVGDSSIRLLDSSWLLTLAGLAYGRASQMAKTVDCLDRAIEADPNNPDARAMRAQAYFKQGKIVAAWADCEHALKNDPSCVPALVMRSSLQAMGGELEEALADATRAMEEDPDSLFGLLNRSAIYSALGQDSLAEQDLETALSKLDTRIQEEPDEPGWLNIRSALKLQKGDPDGAVDDFVEALGMEPTNTEAFLASLGLTGPPPQRPGQFANAVLNKLPFTDPRNSGTATVMAGLHFRGGNFLQAVALLDKAIEMDPNNVSAWQTRAGARLRMGDAEGAIADLTEAMERRPGNLSMFLLRAIIRAAQGDIAGATSDIAGVAKEGIQQVSRGIYLSAQDLSRMRRRLRRELSGFYRDSVQILQALQNGNYQEALAEIEQFESRLSRRPKEPRKRRKDQIPLKALVPAPKTEPAAWASQRGSCYFMLGDYDSASHELNLAVSKEVRPSFSLAARGVLRLRQKRYEDAIADLKEAVSVRERGGMPYKWWPLVGVAIAQMAMGKPELAEKTLSRAEGYEEQNPDLALEREAWLRLLQYMPEAVATWQQWLSSEVIPVSEIDWNIRVLEALADQPGAPGETSQVLDLLQSSRTERQRARRFQRRNGSAAGAEKGDLVK